jgi:hypothetical protein
MASAQFLLDQLMSESGLSVQLLLDQLMQR